MPFVSGYLNVTERGEVDNTLPGGPPSAVDPGWGNRPPSGGTLPEPPPGVWPPPSMGNPIVPVDPGFGGGIPVQPGTIWPSPGRPPHVDAGLPGGGHVSGQPVPPPSGSTLPETGTPRPGNELPSKTYWVLCWNSVTGWAYHAVDPSLRPGGGPMPGRPGHVGGGPMPGQPARPDAGLPPTEATPRRG